MHLQKVVAERKSAFIPLFLLEKSRFNINKFCFKDRFDFRFYFIQLSITISVDCDIKSNIKEFLLSLLKLVAKIFKVLISHIKHWVADKALFFPHVDLTLNLGNFLLELP